MLAYELAIMNIFLGRNKSIIKTMELMETIHKFIILCEEK